MLFFLHQLTLLKRSSLSIYLDVKQLDFNFLQGFNNVYFLGITQDLNMDQSLPTLPALPSLRTLLITFTTGLNEAFQLSQVNGLSSFNADYSEIDERGAVRLLDWIMPSSIETLYDLSMIGNRMGSIPKQLSSF